MPRDSEIIGSQPREHRDESRIFYTRGFMLAFAPFMVITLMVVILPSRSKVISLTSCC